MLDTCADKDVISEDVVKRLGLKQVTKTMTVQTVETKMTQKRRLANFQVESVQEGSSYKVEIEQALVAKLWCGENDIPPSKRDLSKYDHLEDVTFEDDDVDVGLILSVAHAETWTTGPYIRGPRKTPTAMWTEWGYTLFGVSGQRDPSSAAVNLLGVDDAALKNDVTRIFYHDFPQVTPKEMGDSHENRRAILILSKGIRFDEQLQKYVCPLPWLKDREEVAAILNALNSKEMALRRARSMIPRFQRDPVYKQRVFKEMNKFDEKGFCVNIPDDEMDPKIPRWYLPMHAVDKYGKIRMCHDARAGVNGVCLNDFLLGGPNLINPLTDILTRFREHPIAFMTDICGFFHNIRVDERDREVFRYLWFKDENCKEMFIKQFLSHIFGAGSSSVVTSFVLRYHADKIRHLFPDDVWQTLRNNFYVDDGQGGGRTVASAMKLKTNLKEAMRLGGFQLGKWQSNAPELMDDEEVDAIKAISDGDELNVTKVLGVSWDSKADEFIFQFDKEKAQKAVETPRQLVSVQASIYDPLGFLSPFCFLGRKLLQKATSGSPAWDSKLKPLVKEEFRKWALSILELVHIRIPRCFTSDATMDADVIELHVFVDAGPLGFGAVGFRLERHANGNIFINIVMSRSHVVPLNASKASHHNSIPRLELVAAEKGVQIRNSIVNAVEIPFTRVVMWSDSEVVLKQIYDEAKVHGPFVNNRLSKIYAATKPDDWRYVEGTRNPADHCSRGIEAHETAKWREFHRGPDFLYLPEEEWPITTVPRHKKNPTMIFATHVVPAPPEDPIEGCGFAKLVVDIDGWYQKIMRIVSLKKIIAFWRKYRRQNYRNKNQWRSKTSGNLRITIAKNPQRKPLDLSASIIDFRRAENDLFSAIQKVTFGKEWKNLNARAIHHPNDSREMTLKNSSLAPHNPFVDETGIIRVGSRLVNSTIKDESKYPIILPRRDENVRAYIRFIHDYELHAGAKHVLSSSRQRVWIIHGLQEVTSVIRKCVACQKAFKKPLTQKMAVLPSFRVNPLPPYESTGLDLFGPVGVKINKRASWKVWVVVFTCMSTRSVHAEIVMKQDAASLILAIARFSARNPSVRHFISDRGTNMTAADKILKKHLADYNEAAAPELKKKGIQWDFIPAATPHYGGCWERVVGLFKKHLKALAIGDSIHLDVFQTAIVEIEAALNRRPLTAIPSESNSCEAITPLSILHPTARSHSDVIVVPSASSTEVDRIRGSWTNAQALVNRFWNAWRRDYLSLLHGREKWQKSSRNLNVNDLVILVDDKVPRGHWKLGRVIRPEMDNGHVRKAYVRTADGKNVLRDRTKLVHLELDDDFAQEQNQEGDQDD